MKVLYLLDSLVGYGAEKSLVQIALHLEKITPVFVHLSRGDDLRHILEENGVKVYSLDLAPELSPKKARDLVLPIVEKEKPEIIHSTLFKADMVGRSIKKQYPEIKLIGSFVSNSYCKNRYRQLDYLSKIKLFSTQLRDRMTAGRVDFFISNSRAITTSNMKALNVPEDRVKVIYRGRYTGKKEPSPEAVRSLKQQFNLESRTVLLNVGRLNRAKGQKDLIKAFKGISSKHPHLSLVIAGEGTLRTELEKLIIDLELERKVQLVGYQENVAALLALADYFVFPSYYEGLPGALLEAILSKKPAIVSDIPENRECFPGEEALFFPPGDIKTLSLKMDEALKMTNWEERTARAAENAKQNFSIERVSREYEDFYREMAADSDRSEN